MRAHAIVLAVLAACGSDATLPAARFANAPAVLAVDDRRDVPVAPAGRDFWPDLYMWDGIVHRRLIRTLELPRPQRALGVNALDDVPDSTWFTNRIGTRALTPDEVFTGPLTIDSPDHHFPWTVRSTKVGGTTVGFTIKDARGIKYLIKFDKKAYPDVETGTHVVVNRLLWAAGYNVAEDQIVHLRPSDLVIPPDAEHRRLDGSVEGKLDRAELLRELGSVHVERDGSIRALASRWIEGTVIGGHPAEGVRDDDPNDRIRHELRRDLRGAYAIFAWLDHVDVQEGNFVDSWQPDAVDPKRHYVVHYLIDFGKSLGAMGLMERDWRRGHLYEFDLVDMALMLVTLGLGDEEWRHRVMSPPPTVGLYDATTFDPDAWRQDSPAYVPFLAADRFDKFWGAKLVARFTPAELRAAVAAGQFRDPHASSYLVDMLVARQHATAAYWFARVNPLDHFTAAGGDLCFDDLALAGGYADGASTRYTIAAYDQSEQPIAASREVAAEGARTCARQIALAPVSDTGGYTILRVTTARPGFTGETLVHVARDPSTGAPRVIGIWRP